MNSTHWRLLNLYVPVLFNFKPTQENFVMPMICQEDLSPSKQPGTTAVHYLALLIDE